MGRGGTADAKTYAPGESLVKWKLMTRLKEFREEPSALKKVDLPLTQSQRLALQEILSQED